MNRQKILSRKFKNFTVKFLLSFCLFFIFSISLTAFGQDRQEIPFLEINNPLTREISGEAKHGYRLKLSENQYVRIIVEQQGIDVSMRLSGSDGKTFANFDSEMRTNGTETIEWVAKIGGVYQLDVAPRYKFSDGGRYKIELKELRPATAKDNALDEARSLYAESIKQFSAGDYEKAKSLIEQTVEIYRRELGLENSRTALALTHLARITDGLGKYDEAEKINQKVLTVREKILGVDHPDLGYTFNYLALNNIHRGDFQKAIDYHKRALAIREKNFGSNHPIVAVSLINLGVVYDALGDKLKAGELYEQALKIQEKTVGTENLNTAIILNNIGKIYNDLRQYPKAEPYLRRAATILEKTLTPDNPRIFDSMINLAETMVGLGDIEKAETLYLRIFEAREKNVGQNHPLTAHALFNLGNLYALKNDFEKSKSFYNRALKIREEFFGAENPAVAEVLSGLSLLLARNGDVTQAVELQKRADEIDERNISINLAIGSERQKTAFLESLFVRTNQSVLIQTQFATENQTALEFAAVSVLRQKGRVMDAVSNNLSAIRQRFGSADRLLLDDLNGVNTRLSELIINRPDDITLVEYQNKIKTLSDEREKLETEISRRAAGLYLKSASVNLSNIQALIPPDSALIEFAVYDPASFDNLENKNDELRYVVYILQNQGKIKWRDIGRVKDIDKSADLFRQALRDPKRTDFREIARDLDEKLMLPVRKLIGDKKHLLISPDGNLNLIPFEALLDENNKYLVENYAVGYLTSGRDLLRLQTRRESGNKTLVVANPNFGEADSETLAGVRKPKSSRNPKRKSITATRNLSDTYFAPLGGTAQEARAIQAIFPGAEVLTEARATESALKQITAPQILHIATHGFFLEDRGVFTDTNPEIENPLLRSGLAFAGANSREKDGKDDGILTALEASGLNLWGTKLVVLSACDTGLGEVKNGEGVYGLRRAFVLAGTESLVMSLWSVSDLVTRELMTNYYKNLKAGMGRGAALRQVQLEMLKKPNRQHPFYWASFIQSGEWATLDGKR